MTTKKEVLLQDQLFDAIDGKQITRRATIEVTSKYTALCWELNVHLHNFPERLMVPGNIYKADVVKITHDGLLGVYYEVYPGTTKKLTPKQARNAIKKMPLRPPPTGIPKLSASGKMWYI